MKQVQKLLLLSIHGQALLELLMLNAELAGHMLKSILVIEFGQCIVPSFAEVVDHLHACLLALHKTKRRQKALPCSISSEHQHGLLQLSDYAYADVQDCENACKQSAGSLK